MNSIDNCKVSFSPRVTPMTRISLNKVSTKRNKSHNLRNLWEYNQDEIKKLVSYFFGFMVNSI